MDFNFLNSQKELYMPRYIPSAVGDQTHHREIYAHNQYSRHIKRSEWNHIRKINKNKKKWNSSLTTCPVEGISFISSSCSSTHSKNEGNDRFKFQNFSDVRYGGTSGMGSYEDSRILTPPPRTFERIEMGSIRKEKKPDDLTMRDIVHKTGAFPTTLFTHGATDECVTNTRGIIHRDKDDFTVLDDTKSFNYTPSASPSRSVGESPINLPYRYRRSVPNVNNLNSEEMPTWAKALLVRKTSLNRRFQQMKESIQKWSLRMRGIRISETYEPRKSVIFHTEESQHALSLNSAPDRGSDRHAHRVPTNNLVVCMLGLFLMVLAVFPVIVLIFIYKDPSDFVKIEIQMKFNATSSPVLDSNAMAFSICSEVDKALVNILSFYSCDVIRFAVVPEVSDVLTSFRIETIPGKNTVIVNINAFRNPTKLSELYVYSKLYISNILQFYSR